MNREKTLPLALIVILFSIVFTSNAVASGVMRQVLEDNQMIFYVNGFRETDFIGSWQAEEERVFVVVEVVFKNVDVSRRIVGPMYFFLKDGEGREYKAAFESASLDYDLSSYELSFEEMVRGEVAFEIPINASDLQIEYRYFYYSFQVDLSFSPTPDLIPENEYFPLRGVGEIEEDERVELTLSSDRSTDRIGIFKAEDGWIYHVFDVTIKNKMDEEISYNVLYFEVKDEAGYVYRMALCETASLNHSLGSGKLGPNETVKGEIAFEVPETSQTLFLILDDLYSNIKMMSSTPKPTPSPSPTPTPSPTQGPNPSITPTWTPPSTPTLSPSPTPIPTPSTIPTSSPSPSPTPNPTPTPTKSIATPLLTPTPLPVSTPSPTPKQGLTWYEQYGTWIAVIIATSIIGTAFLYLRRRR